MSTRSTVYKSITPRLLLALWTLALVGCSAKQTTPPSRDSISWVGVAGFRWDQREEQAEVNRLLRTNGIPTAGTGSIRADVEVPQAQVGLALALLKTNHLVTTGKIRLLKN